MSMDYEGREYLIRTGGSAVALAAPTSLHDIRCYYEAMETFLATAGTERQFRLRGLRDRLHPSVQETLLNEANSPIWDDYFPSQLRISVLLSVMSLVEHCLNGVCLEAEILLRTPIGQKQLKGSVLERSQTFLEKLCFLSAPDTSSWGSMRRLQQLRSILIHNGEIQDSDQERTKVQRLLESMEGATWCELGIVLEPEFVRYALDEATEFFRQLSDALTEVCEKVKKFEG